ncbi:serine/threonine-protein kinase [Kocuria rosea]|uniref:serine/threonine-protein kinase n=1 Tax=Kocuria rosea TaxID=1275 RepID=UPI00204128B0|nr:serine/threonine-protein kinase [Kocuria rosea]MCM3687285.1 serine/threonine protein kinase [Kocuria rosea]
MADTIAGRYTLIDPIARGGSGAVWRAWDGRLQQLCAAKVLRQRDSADLLRFAREQSVKLDHPHVLAPYGWAAEDVHVVIAMPLVHGGTLESALRDNGAASSDLTQEVLAQLLQALHFVHAQGWVHRDVKPANLMLDSTGTGRPHVFLSDFGIAVRVEDARLTRTGTVVGTPGYLPPEAYGLTDPDPAQDVYAAGVTALRMLDPSLEPWEGLGPDDARAIVGQPGDLAEQLAALLTPDPVQRRRAAVTVLQDLSASAACRRFDPALTRDGEPFEIFDVLDPLPEPWASRAGAGTAPPATEAPVAEASHAPAPAAAPVPPADRGTGGAQRAGDEDRTPTTAAAVPTATLTVPAVRPPAGAAAPAPTRRRRGAAAALLLVLLGITAVLAAYLLLEPPGSAEPGAEPSTTAPAPATPTPSAPVQDGPVRMEWVCEDAGGGRENCSYRAS